jgi:murein DD-endopeptidase MepM/ murein hydrolase activator NlpD
MSWQWPLHQDMLSAAPVPRAPSPAAFGARRRHHIHEGVDLHCAEATRVVAVEHGVVVYAGQFTGRALGHKWWLNTDAVMVEGLSGVVVYGEIAQSPFLAVGSHVRAGSILGRVVHVLPPNKRPRPCMLHLELRAPGHAELFDWAPDQPKPEWLLDPTPLLQLAQGDGIT